MAKFTLLFVRKGERNPKGARKKVVLEASTREKAINLGRKIAQDSKGIWQFEGLDQ
jgi:hypothetical protein